MFKEWGRWPAAGSLTRDVCGTPESTPDMGTAFGEFGARNESYELSDANSGAMGESQTAPEFFVGVNCYSVALLTL